MNYMLITNEAAQAKVAVQAGVNRIMVDLEIIGKHERQGHKDTHITSHTPEDIAAVRAALPSSAELVVRINPYHEETGEHIGSEAEIEHAIAHGANAIMLPMFREVEEVKETSRIINKRVKFVPLFEHIDALECMEEICESCHIDEAYLGLNDLHLSLNQTFLFEVLLTSHVSHFCETAKRYGLAFGFGGIGSVLHERADVPISPSLIIKEHARLGSSRVILSRAFKKVIDVSAFADEVAALNVSYNMALSRDAAAVKRDQERLHEAIFDTVEAIKGAS